MAADAVGEIIAGILELVFESSIALGICVCLVIGGGVWYFSYQENKNSQPTEVVVMRKLADSNIEYKILGTGQMVTKSATNEIFNNVKENDTITIPLYIK